MHSIKFLSHICCRLRIVDAQWFGNGYAVCLNMIHNMGTIFQTLLGFGTNHSREHWKLHWKIVSDCVCYFVPLFSLGQVVLEFVDTYQLWKQRHIAFLQKASLFWASWFKWAEGTFDFSNIEGLKGPRAQGKNLKLSLKISFKKPYKPQHVEIHPNFAREIFCTTGGSFVSFLATKPVVTQSTLT